MGHWQQSEPVSLAPTGEGLPSADSVVRQRSLLHLRLRLRMDHSAILGGIRIPSAPLVQLAPRLSEVVPMLRPTRQIPDGRMGIPSICRNSATASGMAGTTLPCTWSNECSLGPARTASISGCAQASSNSTDSRRQNGHTFDMSQLSHCFRHGRHDPALHPEQ
jgi:hypothetical protein